MGQRASGYDIIMNERRVDKHDVLLIGRAGVVRIENVARGLGALGGLLSSL